MAEWGLSPIGFGRAIFGFQQAKVDASIKGEVIWEIQINVDYAIWVEVGTVDTQPQPYIAPAINEAIRKQERFEREALKIPGVVNEVGIVDMGKFSRVFLSKIGIEIFNNLKRNAPVDSGRLKASIKMVPGSRL